MGKHHHLVLDISRLIGLPINMIINTTPPNAKKILI